MKQIIAFRVDSGAKIGTGHVMRCLTLAKALKDRGVESLFLCRSANQSADSTIERAGFRVIRLPTAAPCLPPHQLLHGDFLVASQDDDAKATLAALSAFPEIDTVIVDHYGIYKPWDDLVGRTFSIYKCDDIADRPHACRGLLDQNYYAHGQDRYKDLVPHDSVNLIGPRFALVRSDFKDIEIQFRAERMLLARALVSFGGNDSRGYSLQVARTLLQTTKLSVSVMGTPNPNHIGAWQLLSQAFKSRLDGPRYYNEPQPEFLKADVFIGAGGTTTWERFACGLPGVVYSIAENQIQMSQELDSVGLQIYNGSIQEFSPGRLTQAVAKFQDFTYRWRLAQDLRGMVDGHGPQRVIDAWGLIKSR